MNHTVSIESPPGSALLWLTLSVTVVVWASLCVWAVTHQQQVLPDVLPGGMDMRRIAEDVGFESDAPATVADTTVALASEPAGQIAADSDMLIDSLPTDALPRAMVAGDAPSQLSADPLSPQVAEADVTLVVPSDPPSPQVAEADRTPVVPPDSPSPQVAEADVTPVVPSDSPSPQVAEADKTPVATSEPLSPMAAMRQQELADMTELSSTLQFPPGQATVTDAAQKTLDRLFEPLFLYSEQLVQVRVVSNDASDAAASRALSEARALTVIDYLEARGLDRERFVLDIGDAAGLPPATHRVTLSVEGIN